MSRDLHGLLRSTADAPTRPLDTAAVVERARRRTRRARAGGGLAAVVVLAALPVVVLPALTSSDQQLEIGDRPGVDEVTEGHEVGGFMLGEDHVWRSAAGSPDEAGLAFVSGVLGWDDPNVIDRGGGSADGPPGHVQLVIASATDRTVELDLEASGTVPDAWEVIQVAAGVDPPVSVTEDRSMSWRPREVPTERYRPFEGTTGVAYVRTLERGMVTIDLDAAAVADAEVPLGGHIDVGEPFCHDIQSALLLFHNPAGEVVSAVGGVWHGDDPPTCDAATSPPSDPTARTAGRAPDAGSDASHWPVELVYAQPPAGGSADEGRQLRFRGTSWAAWTIEQNWTDDGMLPPGRWSEPGGPGLDTADTWVEDRTRWRGVSAELHAEWRSAVGLGQRVVVDLDTIPGGPDLVASLGLTPDEVEAYASPNIASCDDQLARCAPHEPDAARGIAHLATGFPLFAEERYGGGPGHVWLRAESFVYGDVATDAVPTNSAARSRP
jgi:hypothetical protein